MATKEEVYDEKISPLMERIIAICNEHKIANVCSFALGEDEDGDGHLMCTTAMTTEEYDAPESLKKCVKILYAGPEFTAFAVTITEE